MELVRQHSVIFDQCCIQFKNILTMHVFETLKMNQLWTKKMNIPILFWQCRIAVHKQVLWPFSFINWNKWNKSISIRYTFHILSTWRCVSFWYLTFECYWLEQSVVPITLYSQLILYFYCFKIIIFHHFSFRTLSKCMHKKHYTKEKYTIYALWNSMIADWFYTME